MSLGELRRLSGRRPPLIRLPVLIAVAAGFGLLAQSGNQGGAGLDRLPREPSRLALRASRTVVEAARDTSYAELRARLVRESTGTPLEEMIRTALSFLRAAPEEAETESLIRTVGVTIRQVVQRDTNVRGELRHWLTRQDPRSSLVAAVGSLQVTWSGAFPPWSDTPVRRTATLANSAEVGAISYGGESLLFGVLTLVSLRLPSTGRQGPSAELLWPALTLAFSLGLLSVWPPLRAYSVRIEALIAPRPEGLSLLYPMMIYAFCAVQGVSLVLTLLRPMAIAQAIVLLVLVISGYFLFYSSDLMYVVDLNIGSGADRSRLLGCVAGLVPFVVTAGYLLVVVRRSADQS